MAGFTAREIPKLTSSELLKFKLSYTEEDSGCMVWKKSVRGGYGQFKIKGERFPAHRIAKHLELGKLDLSLVVDHVCQNKLCVNPKHLRQISVGDNVLCGTAPTANNAAKLFCNKGHELDPYVKGGARRCGVCEKAKERRRRLLSTMRVIPKIHVVVLGDPLPLSVKTAKK